MKKYFLSYNRDELLPIKDKQCNTLLVDLIAQQVSRSNEKVYFDNIAFLSLDKDIFDNIEKWMQDSDTVVLLLSNSNVFYGWTEKELLSAINYERPIYKISIKKFTKCYIKRRMHIKDIVERKSKKLKY